MVDVTASFSDREFRLLTKWADRRQQNPEQFLKDLGVAIPYIDEWVEQTGKSKDEFPGFGVPGGGIDWAEFETVTPPPPPPPPPTQLVGLHQDLTWYGGDPWWSDRLTIAQTVGAKVSRNSILWHLMEPSSGSINWSRLDTITARLDAAGIAFVGQFVGTPRWASGAPSMNDEHLWVPTTGVEAWEDRHAAFAAKVAARYPGRRWEIPWNEFNERWFWKNAPISASYGNTAQGLSLANAHADRIARHYTKMREAILAADPTAITCLGSVTGLMASGDVDYPGIKMIQLLLERDIDVERVAGHAYDFGGSKSPTVDTAWENNFTDLRRLYEACVAKGRPDIKIWNTEWGWDSSVSEAAQASYVQLALEMQAGWSWCELSTYFMDKDSTPYTYGLYRANQTARPAAAVFAAHQGE